MRKLPRAGAEPAGVNVADVRPGRYSLRGDVVDVVEVKPGATPRRALVIYVIREKNRPRGAIEVGDRGALGIVNFAGWATPIGRKGAKKKR